MSHTILVVLIIFVLTVVMIMSGRGGGNFCVAALVFSGVPMHTASTTSQFILLASALMVLLSSERQEPCPGRLCCFSVG